MVSVKQGIRTKFRAKNTNAKYKLTYKSTLGETISDDRLKYSYSKSVNLSYRGT